MEGKTYSIPLTNEKNRETLFIPIPMMMKANRLQSSIKRFGLLLPFVFLVGLLIYIPLWESSITIKKLNPIWQDEFRIRSSLMSMDITAAAERFNKWFIAEPVYRLNSPNLCENGTRLLIMLNSRPGDLKTRQIIRSTWASFIYNETFGPSIKLAFFWGDSAEALNETKIENERYHDTISDATFTDSYRNVTYLALARYRWVQRYCPHVPFIYKMDTDVWVNFDRLLPLIDRLQEKPGIYGHLLNGIENQGPHREPYSKWFVSKDDYPLDLYPELVCGCGYLIVNRPPTSLHLTARSNTTTVQRLLDSMKINRSYVWIDDIFVTGILRVLGSIPMYHLEGIEDWHPIKPDACIFKEYLSIHKVSSQNIEKVFHQFNDPNHMSSCPNVTRH